MPTATAAGRVQPLRPRRIGVLADDLTGAGDAGVAFADRGFRVEVALFGSQPPTPPSRDIDVWIVDTDSRHASMAEAARRVRSAVTALSRWGARFFFKKIDSALRGPIAAEMKAFLETLTPAPLPTAFVPAFPRMGRTTVHGIQRVGGVPVHRTAFGRDPRAPVRASAVSAALGSAGKMCWFPDVAHQRGLRQTARTILEGRRVRSEATAGSGGLAEELAALWAANGETNTSPPPIPHPPSPVLVIAGSRNPTTRRQVTRLRRAFRGGVHNLLTRPLNSAKKARLVYLAAAPAARRRPGDVLAKLLRSAVEASGRFNIHRYVATGGETAVKLCKALRWKRLRVKGGFETGVPLCTPAEAGAARLVLKPGGFGSPDVLIKAVRMLRALKC